MSKSSFVLPQPDDFADDDRLRRYLAEQLRNGRLALVLGAGISAPLGLPTWPKLIQQLFRARHRQPPKECSLADQAEHFRTSFFKNDRKGFVRAIHNALYRGGKVKVGFDQLRRNPTLAAIASLVMASRRGQASKVVTFNFDNLLELFLSYHGFVTHSVFLKRNWESYSDVSIFHPHGMIPFDLSQFRDHEDHEIVFDQESYDRVIGKADNPWRQLVLTIFRRHTCLFIGLSGADVNLSSILGDCSQRHASRLENTAFWGVTFSTKQDKAARDKWQNRGVFYKIVKDYENALPSFLFSICQEASSRSSI